MNLLTDDELDDIFCSNHDSYGNQTTRGFEYERAIEQAIFAKLKEQGYVVVPPDAYRWLMGLGDDFEPDRKGKYWWRSKFREMIEAGEVSLTSNTEWNEEQK